MQSGAIWRWRAGNLELLQLPSFLLAGGSSGFLVFKIGTSSPGAFRNRKVIPKIYKVFGLCICRECHVLRSCREAKATLASSREEFDVGALEKFKLWEMEAQRGRKPIVWAEEDSLPQGWRVSVGLEKVGSGV